jgi:hypothetical protein
MKIPNAHFCAQQLQQESGDVHMLLSRILRLSARVGMLTKLSQSRDRGAGLSSITS